MGKRFEIDPRILQIAFLAGLLGAGAWLRDFSIRTDQIVLTFAAALGTQALLDRGRLGAAGLLSPAVTAFGLSLLLRADSLWVHPLAAALAIGSKFALRVNGKHVFNPANLGVVVALTVLPGTWVSAGQWGHDVALATWMVALGALVVSRARSLDESWAFLAFHLGALAVRNAWLGHELEVTLHQAQNGALLLFAFFMISDPRTIPSHRHARIVHAAVVATIAAVLGWEFWVTNGFVWALAAASPLVPILDRLWPAPKFEWNPKEETHDVPEDDRLHAHAGADRARPRHAA